MKKSGSIGGALLAGTILLANAPSAKAVTATLSTSNPSLGVILETVTVTLTAPASTGSVWTTTYCHAKLTSGAMTEYDVLYNGFAIGGSPGTYYDSYQVTDSAAPGTYDCWASAAGYTAAPGGNVPWLAYTNHTSQDVQ